MSNALLYFVEGECEKKLIQEGKKPPYFYFRPGKVEIFNVVSKELTVARLLSIKKHTTIVFIYDTDKCNLDILENNLKKLNSYGFNKIYQVQSVKNFEEEIVYSTSLESIDQMFGTVGADNFKQKFITHKNIIGKLNSVNFNRYKIWSRVGKGKFSKYSCEQDLDFIKKV